MEKDKSVLIWERELEEAVWFEECVKIFNLFLHHNTLSKKAYDKAKRNVKNSCDMWILYLNSLFGSDIETEILNEHLEKATSYYGYKTVYENALFGSDLEQKALEKMKSVRDCERYCTYTNLHKQLEKANSIDECIQVYREASRENHGKNHIGEKALGKALSFAISTHDCMRVFEEAPLGSIIKAKAYDKVLEKTKSFNRCMCLFWQTPIDGNYQEKALKKALVLAKTIRECMRVYRRKFLPIDNQVRGYALKKALVLAKTINDFLLIYKKAPNGSEIQTEAIDGALNLAKSFKDLMRIHSQLSYGDDLRIKVLEKALEVANSFREYMKVFKLAPVGDIRNRAYKRAYYNN